MFAWINRRRGRQPEAPRWIDSDALRAELARGAVPVIVDVRSPDEFLGPLGHIDGARNIPLGSLAAHIGELARAQSPIVLVCLTDKRSSQAAAELAAAGIAEVAVLRGGMRRWRGG
jgi:rhodanese-related sulfurtransferase